MALNDSALEESAARRPFVLLDGGTGRELLRLGAPFRQPEWSALALMQAPEYVTQVHQRYIAAGAEVITTNSYAVVPFHIGAQRFDRDGGALARLAGTLARAAAEGTAHNISVAGSLPPVCGSYRPDLFDPTVARPVLQKLRGGLEPFVDIWLSETVGSIAEIILMREVLADAPQPWWVSFTLEDDESASPGARLRSGEGVGPAVRKAVELGAAAVLFNCCQPEVIGDALTAARLSLFRDGVGESASSVLLGAYANAFPPQSATASANSGLSEIRADLGPEEYLVWARRWLASGADVLGGCCGVGPEHIALLRKALRPDAH